MKQAKGEPPGIYTIPVKIMRELDLIFDDKDPEDTQLAETAKMLEERMKATLRSYLSDKKHIDIHSIDDSDLSQDVPSTISSALMRRLNATSELDKLNGLADKIIG